MIGSEESCPSTRHIPTDSATDSDSKLALVPIGLRHPHPLNGALRRGKFMFCAEDSSPFQGAPSLSRVRPPNVSSVSRSGSVPLVQARISLRSNGNVGTQSLV